MRALSQRSASACVICALLLASACGLSEIGNGGELAPDSNETDDAAADEASGAVAGPDSATGQESGAAQDASVDAPAESGAQESGALDASDAGPEVIKLVQTTASTKSSTLTSSTSIAATKTGSLVAVMVTYFPVTATLTGVTDNATGAANTYVSANLRSITGTCQASEIWYARNARPGATSITVTANATVKLETWVVELSGLQATGGVDVGLVGNGAATTTVTAPAVKPSVAPAAVLSVVGSCGSLGSISGTNPFTSIGNQGGNDAAYYIAPSVAMWGPVYDNTLDSWNASTAAFR